MGCCSVHCPHGHTDCELVTLVQREIETASDPTIGNEVQRALAREATQRHFRDDHGRKVPVCSKCGDSGWVDDTDVEHKSVVVKCDCPAGEQV